MLGGMSPRAHRLAAGLAALGLLLAAYLPLLQTIPNGSTHYLMIDVGETQIVLNVWGTLHATGYPLYVLTGAPVVAVLRAVGVGAAAAPGVVSMVTILTALGLVWALAARLTGRVWIAAAAAVAFGLTRTVWIHAEIAEIYALTLLLLVGMLWIALRPRRAESDERRLYALAFLGGLAVAHHRALALAIPALLYAMGPVLFAPPAAGSERQGRWKTVTVRVGVSLLLGLAGFLPYLWLPLRAQAGAAWVYGDPTTLTGFLDQFLGREASRFIGPPGAPGALLANVELVGSVLITDLTWPGLLAGVAGLVAALFARQTRRAAVTLLLLAGAAFAFHALAYTDVLSALILMITLPLALGWALGAAALLDLTRQASLGERGGERPVLPASSPLPEREAQGVRAISQSDSPLHAGMRAWTIRLALTTAFGALALALAGQNAPFIGALVRDPAGVAMIELAATVPPETPLMLPWGTRYFAAGFARDVLGALPPTLQLVDHRADFAALLAGGGSLVTPPDTFYNQPPGWWADRLGAPPWLEAAGPGLVALYAARPAHSMAGSLAANPLPAPQAMQVTCRADAVDLMVTWAASEAPERDWSVFVHGLDGGGTLIAQGDQSAPVFGWRPLTTWAAGEIVRDVYTVAREPGLAELRFGFYRALPDGGFENATTYRFPVDCEARE